MKTVILGGRGFIGSALARKLAERGDTVVITTRDAGARNEDGAVEFAIWDGQDADALARIIEDADAVVSLLGENITWGRWTPERKQKIVDSRVRAGNAVTGALKKTRNKPKALIQASAVNWYGGWDDARTAPTCTEDRRAGDTFLADTAKQWEASTAGADDLGVRRCVIRTAPVIGATGGFLAQVLPVFRAFAGSAVGHGQQPFSWIHLDDEVAAIQFLLDDDSLSGPFNLAAPRPSVMEEFTASLAEAARRPRFFRIPSGMMRSVLGDMADELLLTGQKAVPERLEGAGFNFAFSTVQEALADVARKRKGAQGENPEARQRGQNA